MLSRIPSWAAAVVGTVVVIVATATSSLLLHQTQTAISGVMSEIAEMHREVDRLWSSHLQADRQSTAGDIFFAQALDSGSNQSFLLLQTAGQLRGAVLSMWAASGEPVPSDPPERIATFEEQLVRGEARGYASLKGEVDRLRLLSQSHLNELSSQMYAAEQRTASLQSRASWVYLAFVFFNLLGLMVTMCKDLPIWKDQA